MEAFMYTFFPVLFSFLLLAAPLAFAEPPNPTASDGQENTAGGTKTLSEITGGVANTGFGFEALSKTSSGNANSAFGTEALFANTGNGNTAVGFYALTDTQTGPGNTASGYGAVCKNETGGFNTGTGALTLQHSETGSFNTADGYRALGSLTLGSRNTALGSGAGSLLKVGNNNLYIGHPGVKSESATLRLGDVQTRVFIKGVATTPVNGRLVVITPTGQLGVVPSSSSADASLPRVLEELEQQAVIIDALLQQVAELRQQVQVAH